jgi:ribosomal protein L16 Arg81 hydroxylase
VKKNVPFLAEVRPSLEWLLNPVGKGTFFHQYWEKQPLVVRRGQPDYFASLLSLDDVDHAITTLNLTYPNITLKNVDKDVRASDYTARNGALDVAAVYQLFHEGSTVVLAFLDTVIPSLTSLCRGLEKELCFPLQANTYLTPGRAQGAKYHYDTHDVFVLQIVGSKRWTMYGTPVELPLSNQDFDSKIHERGAPTMDFELSPGDLAYIPRGVVHDARSSDDLSLHITLGVLSYRWVDLLLEFVAEASLKDPAFRKSLPPGFAREPFDRGQGQKMFEDLFRRLATNVDSGPMLRRFAEQWISACPPVLRGQMEQIALIERIKTDSVLSARTGVVSRIETEGGSVTIHGFGRKISFPAYAAAAVRFALDESRFVVGMLPGELDENGKLVLVRRLVREGLVAVLEV